MNKDYNHFVHLNDCHDISVKFVRVKQEDKFFEFDVDFKPVDKIVYHTPAGEGDRHYVDVTWLGLNKDNQETSQVVRFFDIQQVVFFGSNSCLN